MPSTIVGCIHAEDHHESSVGVYNTEGSDACNLATEEKGFFNYEELDAVASEYGNRFDGNEAESDPHTYFFHGSGAVVEETNATATARTLHERCRSPTDGAHSASPNASTSNTDESIKALDFRGGPGKKHLQISQEEMAERLHNIYDKALRRPARRTWQPKQKPDEASTTTDPLTEWYNIADTEDTNIEESNISRGEAEQALASEVGQEEADKQKLLDGGNNFPGEVNTQEHHGDSNVFNKGLQDEHNRWSWTNNSNDWLESTTWWPRTMLPQRTHPAGTVTEHHRMMQQHRAKLFAQAKQRRRTDSTLRRWNNSTAAVIPSVDLGGRREDGPEIENEETDTTTVAEVAAESEEASTTFGRGSADVSVYSISPTTCTAASHCLQR